MIRVALMALLLVDTAVMALLGAGLVTGRRARPLTLVSRKSESKPMIPLPEEVPVKPTPAKPAPLEEVSTPPSVLGEEPVEVKKLQTAPVKSTSEVERILEEFNKTKNGKGAGKNGTGKTVAQSGKDAGKPPAAKSASTTAGSAVTPLKGRTHNIAFTYRNSRAKEVWLVGDFNKWEKGRDPFLKGKDGVLWTCVKKLADGRYAYGYSVDGRVIMDPNNPRHEGRRSLLVLPKPAKMTAP